MKWISPRRRLWSFLGLVLILPAGSHAATVFGRTSLGSFTSLERFTSAANGSDNNDFQNLSGRLYLRIADIGPSQWDVITDVRDKYDFFDKLNQTQLQLDPQNVFQLRQLSTSNFQSNRALNYIFGRFPLSEGGGNYVDGIGVQYRTSIHYRIGLFGGLNPVNEAKNIVELDTKANLIGVYSSYEPKDLGSNRNLIWGQAVVSQQYQGEVDRRYFYHTLFYQWDPQSRISSQTYLDFVPSTYVQNWSLNWDQGISDRNVSHLHFMGVDTIQYRRLQGIRETLPASPYNQAKGQWDFTPVRRVIFSPSIVYGGRAYDGLTKQEFRLKGMLGGWVSPKNELNFFGGSRKNFTSNDQFFGMGFGYYSARWEWNADVEAATEVGQNTTLHPITSTLNVAFVQSKDLFYSLSMEYAKDELVTIMAGLFRLTYRFGSKETPPLRDGAPVRGTL